MGLGVDKRLGMSVTTPQPHPPASAASEERTPSCPDEEDVSDPPPHSEAILTAAATPLQLQSPVVCSTSTRYTEQLSRSAPVVWPLTLAHTSLARAPQKRTKTKVQQLLRKNQGR